MSGAIATIAAVLAIAGPLSARDVDVIAGKRVVFLGDSITQAGGYITFASYYLEKLHPQKDFDFLGLGLASETLSGLSEKAMPAGGFRAPASSSGWVACWRRPSPTSCSLVT